MFGLGLSTLNAVVTNLDFSPLSTMMMFFAILIAVVAVGLPTLGLVGRLRAASVWRRIERDTNRALLEEHARRVAWLAEEIILRERLGLPTRLTRATVVPAPYEAIAASTAAVLTAERAASQVAEAQAGTSAA